MKTHPIGTNITLAGFATLLKAVGVGLFLGEAWYFSQVISAAFNRYVEKTEIQLVALFLCGVVGSAVVVYSYLRNAFQSFLTLIRSYRIDIAAMLIAGLYVSISFGGLGSTKYRDLVAALPLSSLALFAFLPVLIGVLLMLRALSVHFAGHRKREAPFFISDVEIRTKEDDLLDFAEYAERFAERVLNGGSKDSIVFGIDAPWGVGKSTFVNLCTEFWENKEKGAVIVNRFNLLRYANRSDLLEVFVDGLVRTIQKNVFVPEIRPLVSRYARFIQPKASISWLWTGFGVLSGTYSADDAFEDLESALSKIDKKVIVVIDDLDRLSFSDIKDVLFVIKKSFTLPNVCYVLCYDTENVIVQQQNNEGAEKIREFLEKFVSVKISLFLGADTLSRYISQNFKRALQNNVQLDPFTVEQAISAIVDVYKSPDFHNYQTLLGDIRKLKRLINTLVLFEIEKTDFENSDINKHDLVHLLLIYVNYPHIFRKICNTEKSGKRGFFSLVLPDDDSYPKETNAGGRDKTEYKNSKEYEEYLGTLSNNQRFLVNKIFSSRRLENPDIGSVSEEDKRSLACFNGNHYDQSGRNLEAYVDLIVNLSKPQKREQYRFYVNAKNKLLSGGSIEEVLSDTEFSYSESERSRQQLWRVVVNSADEFGIDMANKVIRYLVGHIHEYSQIENDKIGVGARSDLIFFLIKLLDTVGWSNSGGGHRNNTEENIAEIAERIFGEKRHQNDGILDALGAKERGVLGLYDLLLFRLYCSADRAGHFFNLQRALSKHGDPNAPTSGLVSAIVVAEMREISQRVFQIFKDRYLTSGNNLFALIDEVTLQESTGMYFSFVEEKTKSGDISEVEMNHSLALLKTRMKAFITYQLGNRFISSGIGCGYYDEVGNADKGDISAKMNEYLFGCCFRPDGGAKNYEHFLDYLLINFASTFGDDGRAYKASVSEFTKVLDKTRLSDYWKANSDAIRALNLTDSEKEVVTGNYVASYKVDLKEVYVVLDRLAANPEGELQ